MRAGRCMASWINSQSLMIGNVSTEESRNEISQSPGAPSPPANVTIFCFHAFKLGVNRNSSCKSDSLAEGRLPRAQLLREGGAVEMIHKDLHERGAVQIRQLGNFADDADVAKTFNRFAVFAVLIP